MLAPRPAAGDVARFRPPVPRAVGGVLGLPAGTVAALAAWAFAGDHTTGLVFAACAAVVLGALTTPVGAVCAAALCWACYDGFVLHRFGTLDGGRADLVAVGVVVGAALAAWAVATAVRHVRTTDQQRDYASYVHPEAPPLVRSLTR